jgi:endonuclease/exonuclease/phosphatase family metal-dependent hydrolase
MKTFRRLRAISILVLVTSLIPVQADAATILAPRRSPPGQIAAVTINAHQKAVLDVGSFDRLLELVRALRQRPHAFDGGRRQAVAAPDVVVLQEIRLSNLEIMKKLLNYRFRPHKFQIGGDTGAAAKFLYNASTVTQLGEPVVWTDPCHDGSNGDLRTYQYLRFAENETNKPFIVAGVHFGGYIKTSKEDATCFTRNAEQLQLVLATESIPILAGGDFNQGAGVMRFQCDPAATQGFKEWWLAMTHPTESGRAFVDSVLVHHGAEPAAMAHEWTFERKRTDSLCDGSINYIRSRIDYLFTWGVRIAEGHADHPGWGGPEPGDRHPTNGKYSDHRFVSGRFSLAAVERSGRPDATEQAQGNIAVSWQPVEGAASYVVYRAFGTTGYRKLVSLGADVLSYLDQETEHGAKYRYAIAAVDATGAQGVESRPSWATADARGPRVIRVSPREGAVGVAPRTNVDVYVNERIDPDSLSQTSIRMVRTDTGRKIGGRVRMITRRHFVFNPYDPLRRGTTYRVVVRALKDRLGNPGPWKIWNFETETKKRRTRG